MSRGMSDSASKALFELWPSEGELPRFRLTESSAASSKGGEARRKLALEKWKHGDWDDSEKSPGPRDLAVLEWLLKHPGEYFGPKEWQRLTKSDQASADPQGGSKAISALIDYFNREGGAEQFIDNHCFIGHLHHSQNPYDGKLTESLYVSRTGEKKQLDALISINESRRPDLLIGENGLGKAAFVGQFQSRVEASVRSTPEGTKPRMRMVRLDLKYVARNNPEVMEAGSTDPLLALITAAVHKAGGVRAGQLEAIRSPPRQRLEQCLASLLKHKETERVWLCIENIDRLEGCVFAPALFAMLQSWSEDSRYQKLRILLSSGCEPQMLVASRDAPLSHILENVERVYLAPLTPIEAAELIKKRLQMHYPKETVNSLNEDVRDWLDRLLGGHPGRLTQLANHLVAQPKLGEALERLETLRLNFEAVENLFSLHLADQRRWLQSTGLGVAIVPLLRNQKFKSSDDALLRLQRRGILRWSEEPKLSCELYSKHLARYFL